MIGYYIITALIFFALGMLWGVSLRKIKDNQ
jgi:hypothetical protein